MLKFFFLHNFVNSAHTGMYGTSNESCAQGLYFFFLTSMSFGQFMGMLCPQNWKKQTFLLITESFLHIESCVMLLLKASSRPSFRFLTLTDWSNIWGRYHKKKWKLDDLSVLSIIVWFTISVLSDLSLKPQTNECMLTFKVKVKVK